MELEDYHLKRIEWAEKKKVSVKRADVYFNAVQNDRVRNHILTICTGEAVGRGTRFLVGEVVGSIKLLVGAEVSLLLSVDGNESIHLDVVGVVVLVMPTVGGIMSSLLKFGFMVGANDGLTVVVLDGVLDGALSRAFDGAFDGELNEAMDEPLDGALDGALVGGIVGKQIGHNLSGFEAVGGITFGPPTVGKVVFCLSVVGDNTSDFEDVGAMVSVFSVVGEIVSTSLEGLNGCINDRSTVGL